MTSPWSNSPSNSPATIGQEQERLPYWRQQALLRQQAEGNRQTNTNIKPLADVLMQDPIYTTAQQATVNQGKEATSEALQSANVRQQRYNDYQTKVYQQQQAAAIAALGTAKAGALGDMTSSGFNGSGSGGGLAGSAYSGNQSQIAQYARQAGFPEAVIPTVVAIAEAESSGNAGAVNNSNSNGTSDYGLMQINSVHSDLLGKFDWKDPQQNMNMAFQIYQGAGNSFSPWSTFNSGTYNKFLGAAKTAAAVVPANIPSYVTQTPTGLGQVIVSDAKAYLGLPYVWSGGQGNGPTTGGNPNGPLGFDCSGLVQSVYAQVGIKLPRTADQQAHYGTRTSISALQPGDLVAWQGGYRGPNYVGHIAIYIGNGQIEEAPFTGANVRIRSLRPDENVFGVHITSVNT